MARPTFSPAALLVRLIVVLAVLAAAPGGTSRGSNYSWSGDTTGNWNDASKWTLVSGSGSFPSIQDGATFSTASGNVTVSLGLSANRGQQSVGFLNFSGVRSFTFQGGVAGGSGAFNILTLTGDGFGGGGITLDQFFTGAVTIGTATGGVQVNVAGNQTIQNSSSLTFNNGIAGVSTGINVLTFGGGATGNTTLNGSITDSTTESQAGSVVAVVMNGSGILQFSGPNGYSGGTTLNNGFLFLGHDNGLGTAAQTLRINGGTLAATGAARTVPAAISVVVGGDSALGGQGQAITFNGTVDLGGATRSITVRNDATFAAAVFNGGITKLGTATLTLAASGGNTYAGPTTINAGTLSVTNTAGSATGGGSVTVNGGSAFGTLRGTGIITGPVTINAGSTAAQNAVISPGTPATNGLSTLTLNGGLAMHGTYNATIDPNGAASSLLTVSGMLDLTGGFSTLNVSLSAVGTPSATYTLATFGALNGTFTAANLPTGYVVNYHPTSITISPVPEPAFLLVVCSVGTAMCWRRRGGAGTTSELSATP